MGELKCKLESRPSPPDPSPPGPSPPDREIVIEIVRELWREYQAQLPEAYRNFGEEIAALAGPYTLFLRHHEGHPAGTIALRPLGPRACEIKRLYVRPAYRGHGHARALLTEALEAARAKGCTHVFADTLPTMQSALALYQAAGFKERPPYSTNPTPGAIYLEYVFRISATR